MKTRKTTISIATASLLALTAIVPRGARPFRGARSMEVALSGLDEGQAMSLAVNGFVNDLIKAFPMEYSVELKRLIEMEMEGSVG